MLLSQIQDKVKTYGFNNMFMLTGHKNNLNLCRSFHNRCRAINRIGPHNLDVVSTLFGLLLGDGYASNRSGEGVRFFIKQSIVHKEYLFGLYKFFLDRGYCSSLEPRIYNRTIKDIDKIYQGYEFNTYTFRSFVWIYKLFYKKGKKVIPLDIANYMTPLTLAIWIMDDGGWANSGIRIATFSFEFKEINLLTHILKYKFDLDCTMQSKNIGTKVKYAINIKKNSIPKLKNLIMPYLDKSMVYKLDIK